MKGRPIKSGDPGRRARDLQWLSSASMKGRPIKSGD